MSATVITAAVITFAFFSQSVFGFGGGLIAIPLLSLFYSIPEAVTLALIFQLLMGLLIFRTYRQTRWEVVTPLLGGLAAGVFVGMAFLHVFNEALLRIILASFILAYLAQPLFFPALRLNLESKLSALVCGAVGGVFQGVIGTGGPPLVAYLSSALADPREVRAGVILLLVASNVLRVALSAATGLFTERVTALAAAALLPFLAAIAAGQLLHTRVSPRLYRLCINAILLASGVSLLAKAF